MGKRRNHVLISYKNLRRLIGILGLSLPVICLAGPLLFKYPVQPSISHCYYTNVRDVFIGIMIGVSMFLVTYNGYNKIDNWITNTTGFFGFAIALCPCFCFSSTVSKVGFLNLNPPLSDMIHLTSAVFFFLLLAINSIFLFTKSTGRDLMTKNKKKRNRLFVTCGIVIISSLLALFVLRLQLGEIEFNNKPIVFYIESAMLTAFGISWLVKGETLWRDKALESGK
ncbi:MAG: hypothetical protein JW915_18775 [Chitinispirillaceae bacterium]|nr:hypothetical protein [Chitinispirillaceae bacterium]